MKNSFFCMIFIFLAFSCNKKAEKPVDDPHRGYIKIEADESFSSVIQSLTEAYTNQYPSTKIDFVTKKEDLGFMDLLNGKIRVAVMSRELSPAERAAFEKKFEWQPAKFAGDGVVFIVPKNSEKSSITYEEIQNELNSEKKNIIFDGTNSSNLNFVAQNLGKKPSELQFSVISGNTNLIEQLNKFPDKIGVISLNTISRPYGAEAEKLRGLIKILPVVKDGKTYEPSLQNIKNMSYPFTRILYFLTNEPYYGLGNGFIRFSCTQIGQIIVDKEGLQPYNTYKREVQMK
ncbi:PstS family phosphate ABC transporter substrate-binding protein [Halpernia frigidisoli]|uniref:Phosphate transport system substrate-binding protein n=1 Tax=Halpernia frigidisoli TaxID=1125876 RepID=A0A1I3I0A7_9FLAO|nr:substrate-binding domain-containing protein [Halpernia frigidisoli]SFI41267.1 phosphate transport system substrate-binding protein [Halpernia frigidisoli]